MGWRFLLSLVFAFIVAIFAIQNAVAVQIHFFIWEISISQALVILISALLGAVTATSFNFIKKIKLNSIIKSNKKTITTLEEDNISLKKKVDDMLKSQINDKIILEQEKIKTESNTNKEQ
ncbi:MAG: LapA family protein [Anaerovoracaceae bacterium]|jgi:uncharacterized integral membrane protein